MGILRIPGAAIAALLIGLTLSACGSSRTGQSAGDPASIVPASVPVYLSLQVPDSAKLTEYRQIVTELAGTKAWTGLSSSFTRMLSQQKVSWSKDIAPWIGTRVGLAFLNLKDVAADSGDSDNGVVIILPTGHIKAALAFAKRHSAASGETAEQDGANMIVSNAATLAQFTAATGSKLNADASYTSVNTKVAGDDATVYGNLHAILSQVETGAAPAARAKLNKAFSSVPADAAAEIGLTTSAKTISLDVIPHDLSADTADTTSTSGSVADLPSDAIVAAAANLTLSSSFLSSFTSSFLSSFNSSVTRSGATLGDPSTVAKVRNRVLSVITAVAPAFGPLRLAIGGTGLLSLHGGLAMTPASPAAGTKLLSLLFQGLQGDASRSVSGTAKDFTLKEGPFTVHFTEQASQLLALLNEPSAANLLLPSAKLASDGAYKSAAAQLPSGTTSVPFYLSFSGLSALVGPILGAEDAQDQQVAAVLKKLSYLIAGDAPGDVRVVLGLR